MPWDGLGMPWDRLGMPWGYLVGFAWLGWRWDAWGLPSGVGNTLVWLGVAWELDLMARPGLGMPCGGLGMLGDRKKRLPAGGKAPRRGKSSLQGRGSRGQRPLVSLRLKLCHPIFHNQLMLPSVGAVVFALSRVQVHSCVHTMCVFTPLTHSRYIRTPSLKVHKCLLPYSLRCRGGVLITPYLANMHMHMHMHMHTPSPHAHAHAHAHAHMHIHVTCTCTCTCACTCTCHMHM